MLFGTHYPEVASRGVAGVSRYRLNDLSIMEKIIPSLPFRM